MQNQKNILSKKKRELIRKLILEEGHFHPSDFLIEMLLNRGTLISLRRNQTLIAEGEVNPHFYILTEGIMRKWYWNDSIEVTSAFALPGTQILDYQSYYAGKGSIGYIEACCPSKLLRIDSSDYNMLLTSSMEFSNWRLQMAYNQLYFLEVKQKIITGDARERYLALLRNRPEILKRVPLKIIATYLGITPQYLSNLRQQIASEEA